MEFIEGIIITEIGNKKVAICTGESADVFKGFINLNESGYEIWKCLEKGMDVNSIAKYLAEEYQGLDFIDALAHVNEFVNSLKGKGILSD